MRPVPWETRPTIKGEGGTQSQDWSARDGMRPSAEDPGPPRQGLGADRAGGAEGSVRGRFVSINASKSCFWGGGAGEKLNFMFSERVKTRHGFSPPNNSIAAGGLREVGQEAGLGSQASDQVRRGAGFGLRLQREPRDPLSGVGKAVGPGFALRRAKVMTAKTYSRGYKTGPQAKNRHFGRSRSFMQGGGWREMKVGYRLLEWREQGGGGVPEAGLLAPFYERWVQRED